MLSREIVFLCWGWTVDWLIGPHHEHAVIVANCVVAVLLIPTGTRLDKRIAQC
jgi:hypothetical protein